MKKLKKEVVAEDDRDIYRARIIITIINNPDIPQDYFNLWFWDMIAEYFTHE